jgi:hypothetical protein
VREWLLFARKPDIADRSRDIAILGKLPVARPRNGTN